MSASRYRRWGLPWPRAALAPLVAFALLGALLAGSLLAGRASAAPPGSCTPTHGTIVAVDFAHWGGPIVRGCGVGRRTGYALLHAAGFTTAGDAHDGPAIICRLGDAAFRHGTEYPTPNQQSCVQTPPTTGYWAYWVAPAGSNHWAYSPLGAMGDVPRPGEVELWIFGATNVAGTRGTAVPTFSPATLRPHAIARRRPATHTSTATTSATTTTTATTTSSGRASSTQTSSVPANSTPTTTRPRHAPAVRHASPRRAAHRAAHHHRGHRARRGAAAEVTGTSTTSPVQAGRAKVVAARPTNRAISTPGSATPLIVGGALVLLLCAGAGRAIWQRRRER